VRILVTGSAGFIGHHVSQKLLEQGHFVVGVDDMNDYYSPNLKAYRNDTLRNWSLYEFIEGDIANRAFVSNLFSKYQFDVVINLAAQAGVRLPVSEFHKYTSSNLVGFENVATNAIMKKVKVFMYASSSSVYGDFANIPLREDEVNLKPNSYYGSTKLANEISAKSIFRGTDCAVMGLRFFSVYGPMGRPDMAYFKLLASALRNLEFKLFGEGQIERDFTYISDVVANIELLMLKLFSTNSNFNDVVNIGGGRPMSMLKLIEIVENLADKKVNVVKLPADAKDSQITQADTGKLAEYTSRPPMVSLEDGMRITFEWMKGISNDSRFNDWIKL
jgi:UDP-glucuronate 4-epimerase